MADAAHGGGRRYVALLRGVNVGGRTKVAMAALRATCESIGCRDVTTYIQSGNVLLTSPLDETDLRAQLEAAIAGQLGVSPTVMVRTAEEMAAVLAGTPYPDSAEIVHVAFLHVPPTAEQEAALTAIDCAPEVLRVLGREIYLRLPNGMGRAKLPVELGKRFKEPMTVRNWRTVGKLVEMSR